jgi:hypothetical protein
MEWRVRPDSEAGVLTQASRSRLEGNARLIGNGGSATYSFRILGGMDIALRLTISGEGQVRVRTQAGGLLARAFRGGIQQLNLTTRAPLNPPVQTLQVMVETKRRTQARVYELQLVASDRDEDRDGIGDGVERLLGAPANALRPTIPATPRSGELEDARLPHNRDGRLSGLPAVCGGESRRRAAHARWRADKHREQFLPRADARTHRDPHPPVPADAGGGRGRRLP